MPLSSSSSSLSFLLQHPDNDSSSLSSSSSTSNQIRNSSSSRNNNHNVTCGHVVATLSNNNNNNNNNNNITYGHVHFAKTAGTEINGMLALYYERVCGHKGYSFDYHQFNERAAAVHKKYGSVLDRDFNDAYSRLIAGTNRGRVEGGLMDEIGYEDCDYISMERSWTFWKSDKLSSMPLELHVPCRDPLEHFMSQCNYRRHVFNCTTDNLEQEVTSCIVDPTRFSLELEKESNIQLKCFNPIPVDKYLRYMSQYLQKKKRQPKSPFIHRMTNAKRKKETECIWKSSPDIKERVRNVLVENYDLYKFCSHCVGYTNELELD